MKALIRWRGIPSFLAYSIQDASGTTIYQTRPDLINYNGNLALGGIIGALDNPIPTLYGQIEDRSNLNHIYGIEGILKITYIPCQDTGCDPQIRWVIKKPKELVTFQGAPDDYNLPTDIVLTKTN